MAVCSRCENDLPLEAFTPSRRRLAERGVRTWCADCARAHAKAKYAANRAELASKARGRMRRERTQRPEHVRERERAYWERNPDRKREKDRRHAANRSDEAKQRVRENWRRWRARHVAHERERIRAVQAERLARKLDQWVERVDALVVLERADGVCGICGEDVDPTAYHVDHVIPLSRGGAHSYANTQPAHPFCNIAKGARLPEDLAA